MKFAYYPGCAAKATTPEVDQSTRAVCEALGIELVDMPSAPCCGAGVIQAKDELFSDSLNARTFSIAEDLGLDVMTVCGTCTGYMRKANIRLDDPERRTQVNEVLAGGGACYSGRVEVNHLQWILERALGLEALAAKVVTPLEVDGRPMRVAPFYGCHIIRPARATGHDDVDDPQSLERIIRALGGEPVDYSHRLACCGFPILLEREQTALKMTGESVGAAWTAQADLMVTPCPLCHLNLDLQQGRSLGSGGSCATAMAAAGGRLKVLHLAQLVGLGLGLTEAQLGMSRHFVAASRPRAPIHHIPAK